MSSFPTTDPNRERSEDVDKLLEILKQLHAGLLAHLIDLTGHTSQNFDSSHHEVCCRRLRSCLYQAEEHIDTLCDLMKEEGTEEGGW